MATYIIKIPRAPVGKGRPRWAKRTGHAFTPQKTRDEEAEIIKHVQANYDLPGFPLSGPLEVKIYAHFAIPGSLPAKERRARAMQKYHTHKPDADNVGKLITDALNGIVWGDDSQIAIITISKFWTEDPHGSITLSVEDTK